MRIYFDKNNKKGKREKTLLPFLLYMKFLRNDSPM